MMVYEALLVRGWGEGAMFGVVVLVLRVWRIRLLLAGLSFR